MAGNILGLPSLSGRPNFPSDLKVLLVSPPDKRAQIIELLKGLSYDVTAVDSVNEACAKLVVVHKGEGFDIVLTEAHFCKPGATGKESPMMSASRSLPCVLMAEEGTSMQALMQMVELGAVDVLQKPLTKERLQNIWQHVVRKLLSSEMQSQAQKAACSDVDETQPRSSGPCTPRTPSRAASFVFPSESTEAKSMEQDISSSGKPLKEAAVSSAETGTSDSSSSGVSKRSGPLKTFLHACRPKGKVFGGSNLTCSGEKGKSTKVAVRNPPALGTPANGALAVGPCGRPPWPGLLQVNPQGGCVWGTPVPAAYLPCLAPLTTSNALSWEGCPAADSGSTPVCLQPVPMQEVVPTSKSEECDPPPNVDLSPWLDDFVTNMVGDVLIDRDERAVHEKTAPGGSCGIAPPLGLKLRKSSSFLDLINCARSRGSSMFAML